MRNRVAITMIALALVAALVIAIAYGRNPGFAPGQEKVIAIFKEPASANAFWAAVSDGVESGAKDFGLSVSFRAPHDETAVDEQIKIMRDSLAEKPAAIVLAAGDFHRLVEPVRYAKALGIPVVCVDSFIESEDADSKIGTDSEAGQKCGAALLRDIRGASASDGAGQQRIAVMSYVQGSSTAIGRESGLLDALDSKVRLIGTSYSSSDADIAYGQAKAILAKEPALAGIAALNLPTILGAARALSESGREGRWPSSASTIPSK